MKIKLTEEQLKTLMKEGKKNDRTLCARGIASAKSKYDVYPSAYANGHAVQVCKGKIAGLDGNKKCGGNYCKGKNESVEKLDEDLAVWFGDKKKKKGSKQPQGPWVNICKKKSGGGHPECGRGDSDKGGYPVCRAKSVASNMSQSDKDSACRRKRDKEKNDGKSGKGQSPSPIKVKGYKPKKKKYEPINEGVGSFLLTAVGVYSFYKFIQGLRGKDKPKESNYGKSNWSSLNVYVRDFIKQGGKIEYEDNGWYHVFKVGDITIKIDQNNKTVFWTHIVPDIKRLLKYKPEKRFEITDIDEIEHDHTIPIPISQENIDLLVSSVKEDMGHKEINETKKKK